MSRIAASIAAGMFLFFASQLTAGIAYVSPIGDDAGDGSQLDPWRNIQTALDRATQGDSVIVLDGLYEESLVTSVGGVADARITIRAENAGNVTITNSSGRLLDVRHPYLTFEGLIFDGQFNGSDIIRVRVGADYGILDNVEVRNGDRDGIDLGTFATTKIPGDFLEGFRIQDSRVHHLLKTDQNNQRVDAHAIVAGGVRDFVIRDTEAYYVSGDALQVADGAWDNVLVDSVTFWNGPLPEAIQGFAAGANPGENAVDVKQDHRLNVRGTMTIRNSEFYGWGGDFISNAAALNLKERVAVTVESNIIYDSEIAMRLRGRDPSGFPDAGAHVTATNNVMFDLARGIRYEDRINNLHVYNNTFGDGIERFFQPAPTKTGAGNDFLVRNNLFLAGSTPSQASDPSNLAVDSTSFVDISSDDYRLVGTSSAIDAGGVIPEVTIDRFGTLRPQGDAIDVGAFEYLPDPSMWLILGSGKSYAADFNELGRPSNWHILSEGQRITAVEGVFPPDVVTNRAYNAGNDDDKAFAIGVRDTTQENSLTLEFHTVDDSIHAISLQYDIEAWGASLSADNPGEAAFNATLHIGDETLVDFGIATTGAVLSPGLLNGNDSPNRVSFDSGVIEIDIPSDTLAQLKWSVPNDSATNGWLFGLDNVRLRALAPGDVDGNGTVDPTDIVELLKGGQFGQGPNGVTWQQGDFDGDDQFGPADLVEVLTFLSGQFPVSYASEMGNSNDAVPDVMIDLASGEVTIDFAGHTSSSIIIDSAAGIFNGDTPAWDTMGEFRTASDHQISNTMFNGTESGVDFLGSLIKPEFSNTNFDFNADLTVKILVATPDGPVTVDGHVIISDLPEPRTWVLLGFGSLGFMAVVRRRDQNHRSRGHNRR